jgi:hypothetical protein
MQRIITIGKSVRVNGINVIKFSHVYLLRFPI